MFEIKGKTAIITGGTSGIGLATAEALLKKGAKVVISGRGAQRGAEAEAKLKEISPDVVYCQTDTSKEEDVKKLVDFAVEKFGSLDIMFNNAGIGIQGTVDQMSGEDFRKVIDINLNGVFYGIVCSYPDEEAGQGRHRLPDLPSSAWTSRYFRRNRSRRYLPYRE